MPRKDTSRIRTLLVRLDLDNRAQLVLYERYVKEVEAGNGAGWIRDALWSTLTYAEKSGDSNQTGLSPLPINEEPSVVFHSMDVTPDEVIAPVKVDVSDSTPAKPKAELSPAVAFDEQTKKAQERYRSDTGQDEALDKAKVTSPTPLPPGYAPRQKTSVFSSSVRPIPAFVGRKSE